MTFSKKAKAKDSNSDSDSEDSIPRYGGYKHSSAVYEDFEMWNSVCEDAEPGWEYKEAQRLEKKERKKAKKEVARKAKEEEKEKSERETAEMRKSQTPTGAPAITRLVSPFDYQRSKHTAQLCTQDLAKITQNNNEAEERDSVAGAEGGESKIEYDTQSPRGLAIEEVLGISRPDNVKKQPRTASGARTCALM
ncbi:hypothetical protein KCU92_g7184, partial [Aureobasidium melanogenum]|jgi:hypothetical protein